MFKPRIPPGINPDKQNLYEVKIPYHILKNNRASEEKGQENVVIFWGVPVWNFKSVYADEKAFIDKANLCLDYVRRNCGDCELIYKLHPSETTEPSSLDLKGYNVLSEKTVAEFYILKNYDRIKYVFSTYSSSAMTSYKLGLNAYIFLPIVESTFTPLNKEGNRNYFKTMPPEFYISDLNQELKSNNPGLATEADPVLTHNFSEVLNQKKGAVWFTIGDPGLLTTIITLSRFIKSLSPRRRIGLIIEKHHRWQVMNLDEVKSFFDETIIYPRWFPYFRLKTVLGQLKTAGAIKKAPISPEDIFMCLNFTSFVENCFISYFPENTKIAFLKKETLDFCYGLKDPSFFDAYFTRIGPRFYHSVTQPLLGLERSIFYEDPVRVANYDRYLKAVNDLYDQVYKY